MVSVIIPTYERPEKAVEAIRSVQKQKYRDIEIIIVDDNGKGTELQIETENRISSLEKDARIKYIVHSENKGGCAARNTGIKNALGDFVAFLDDDDIWSERFIEVLIKHFTDDLIGAVYCDFYSYDGFFSKGRKQGDNQGLKGDVYENILQGRCPASTSLFVVRKKCFDVVGMFDENLKSFQDYDMWLRLSKKFYFQYCDEKLVIKYEGFGEQTSRNPKRRTEGFNYLINKWDSLLNEHDKELFNVFKKNYYCDTLYRRIVYNKKHGKEYKKDLKEYLSLMHSFGNYIHIFLRLYLNDKLYIFLGMFLMRFNKKVIYYKGIKSI